VIAALQEKDGEDHGEDWSNVTRIQRNQGNSQAMIGPGKGQNGTMEYMGIRHSAFRYSHKQT
jgi:hypothetical protein